MASAMGKKADATVSGGVFSSRGGQDPHCHLFRIIRTCVTTERAAVRALISRACAEVARVISDNAVIVTAERRIIVSMPASRNGP